MTYTPYTFKDRIIIAPENNSHHIDYITWVRITYNE